LIRLEERRGGRSGRIPWTISNGTYLAWREGASSTIEEIGGWFSLSSTFRGAGDPDRIRLARVTPSAFALVRARPALGRLFTDDDPGSPTTTATAILSHAFWQQRFNGASDVIGRTIQLDERPHTIVGVMPAGFDFPDRETQVWVPARIQPVSSGGGKYLSVSIFSAMARMRPGVTPAQVAAEATARARAGDDLGPAGLALFGTKAEPTIVAVPALQVLTGEVRPGLLILLAAVVLLLMTAIGSIAIVQLARAAKRQREMTVRAALGASTGRLTRQWLTESALVGASGGLAGFAGAAAILRMLPSILPADFPRLADVSLDWRAATYACAATVTASLITGWIPALQSRRMNLAQSIAVDSVAVAGGTKHSKARTGIMIGQIAVACLLLIGAGLLGRSLLELINIDRGYEPRNLLTGRLILPRNTTFDQVAGTAEPLMERLRALPGVSAAGFGNALPFVSAGGLTGLTVRAPQNPAETFQIQALHRTVSPSYFDAMGLRLIAGRYLHEVDTAGSPPSIVVNRSFARQYLGQNPIGQRLNFRGPGGGSAATVGMADREAWEVVGVVADMRQGGLDVGRFVPTADTDQPEFFVSYRQLGVSRPESVFVVVRTRDDPSPLASTLRPLIRQHAPSLVLDSVMTMEDRLMASLARPRTYAVMLVGFAVFALAIAGVGLFGVLSYGVVQRTREIGVRTALGAKPSDVVALVLKHAVLVMVCGIAIGVTAAAFLATTASTLLYGIRPHDTFSFVAAPVVVAFVGLVACLAPVRRAVSVDPLRALRTE
jgi:putative ABC transport system permease protein